MRVLPILLTLSALSLGGCYSKHLVLQAEVVSMTKLNSGKAKNLKMGKEIKTKWCIGDEVLVDADESSIGLVDQVIYKAQDQGRAADFITDVRIYRDTKGCALLTGTQAKQMKK